MTEPLRFFLKLLGSNQAWLTPLWFVYSQLVVRLQHLLAAGERSCLGWEPLGQSFIPQWPKDNQERCFTGKKRMDLVWHYNSFAIHNFLNWVATTSAFSYRSDLGATSSSLATWSPGILPPSSPKGTPRNISSSFKPWWRKSTSPWAPLNLTQQSVS